MQRKGIKTTWASLALTMLSLAECLTYMIASFLGDYLKDRLVYVNVASSGALATICIVWPLIDVTYGLILVISLGQRFIRCLIVIMIMIMIMIIVIVIIIIIIVIIIVNVINVIITCHCAYKRYR